ncbi:MAG: 50S ribosomal protein L23 [Chloroflexi bacterium]|nr:50S ribosomal protein L23 [Chloroflexota bacterium]
MHFSQVLRRPLITEKMTRLGAKNKYAFEVDPHANRLEVSGAVEKAFNVKVASVNILWVKGKTKRMGPRQFVTPSWKKAVVTLREGYKLQLFEGV